MLGSVVLARPACRKNHGGLEEKSTPSQSEASPIGAVSPSSKPHRGIRTCRPRPSTIIAAGFSAPLPSLSRPLQLGLARHANAQAATGPGANVFSAPLKQIDAGVLNVGYAEAGVHQWPDRHPAARLAL